MTNAYCEAKNNTVKTIVKAGYGFKNFKYLRHLILIRDREKSKRNNFKKEEKYNNYIRKNVKKEMTNIY